MNKKLLVLTLTLLMLPSVVLAWTMRTQMNGTYPDLGGGWQCYERLDNGYGETIADGTTLDPPKSLHMHIKEYMHDGGEPASCFTRFESVRELYFQYYFKYDGNHVFHPTLDKQVYFYRDNIIPPCDNFGECNRIASIFTGIVGGESNPQFGVVWGGYFGQPYRFPNVGKGSIQKGKWYKVNGHVKFGTPGNKDGNYDIWLNDVHIHQYSGLPFLRSTDTGITESSITPVWGGVNNITAPAGGMDMWFDDLIISTEPITGMKSILPDPQQKVPNPPSKLLLN